MKYFLAVLLLVTIAPVSGVTIKDQKIKSEGKAQYHDYVCKAKILPISVRYIVGDSTIKVDLTFEKDLKGFQVFDARGIDGLEVYNFSKSTPKDVLGKNKESFEYEYSKTTGLAYLVLEVKAKINGISRIQMMTIPVGEQSREQISENRANIVTKGPSSADAQQGTKPNKTKRIHRLQFEKVK